MKLFLIRFLESLLSVLSPLDSPQRAVLEVAFELQRLDYRLFEICESLSLPSDVLKMRENRVPRTVQMELLGIVEMIRSDYLAEAVASLLAVVQVTEEEIREEFFEVQGTRSRP